MNDERFRLSLLAVHDVEGVASFIAARNPSAAIRTLDALHQTFATLGEHPDLGTRRDDLRPGLRVFSPPRPAHNYVVLYYATPAGVEINGVLHGAREWELIARGDR